MNRKYAFLALGIFILLIGSVDVCAAAITAGKASGIGGMAETVRKNLGNVARLITALSYVGGMAFAIGAIAKFKAHKDNPTQIPIGTPIALLFIGAALIFIPSVFSTAGGTLFGGSGVVGGVSGVSTFN